MQPAPHSPQNPHSKNLCTDPDTSTSNVTPDSQSSLGPLPERRRAGALRAPARVCWAAGSTRLPASTQPPPPESDPSSLGPFFAGALGTRRVRGLEGSRSEQFEPKIHPSEMEGRRT
eukprot:3109713-Rhodomonas_salina.1